jgi:hypothetical protein
MCTPSDTNVCLFYYPSVIGFGLKSPLSGQYLQKRKGQVHIV